ncbi:hypothetical protein GWK47_051556 [Chionoecetes opilio]|uniref:Uncharacterized protein n=1 Tax=Chionoecetes opilio TaxID=41210 RepID=A0A8J5CQM4_CHIOP|nr:hypothetical protein GWK47_051556 [Chionoecetes opilio]
MTGSMSRISAHRLDGQQYFLRSMLALWLSIYGCTNDPGSFMVTKLVMLFLCFFVLMLLLVVGPCTMPNASLRRSLYTDFPIAPCHSSISSRIAPIIGGLLLMWLTM